MQLQGLLRTLYSGAQELANLAHGIGQSPALAQAAAPSLEGLVKNLHYVEAAVATLAGRMLQRPLPMPSEDAVGAWAGQMLELPGLADPAMPDEIVRRVQTLRGQIEQVRVWAQGAAKHVQAGAMGAPGGVPQPQVGEPTTGQKAAGWVLLALSAAGGIGTVLASMSADKRRIKNFGADPDLLTPQDAELEGQRVLDHELPGSSLRVTRTPDGGWYASVRKGTDTLARVQSHDPARAAGQATQQALDLDQARSESLEGVSPIGARPVAGHG